VLTPSGHGHKTVLWTYRMDPNLTTLQCMARHTCTIISPCLHSTHGPTHLQRPPQHCDTSAQLHGHVTTLQVSCTPFHRPLHPQLHTLTAAHIITHGTELHTVTKHPPCTPQLHTCTTSYTLPALHTQQHTRARPPTPSLHSRHS
jgi:hypothetical protein